MLVIDRFEGDFAVIETDNWMVNLPKSDLPNGAKEGDVLTLTISNNETSSRKKKINGMMNRLFKD